MIDPILISDCAKTMHIISWDEIWRAMTIAPTVVMGVGYGYWLAIRGNDLDVRDLKEAANMLSRGK